MFAGEGNFPGEAGRWEKRIVQRIHEKGGDADLGEVRLAARLLPIITGIGETVERSGETIIELGEGLHLLESIQIEDSRELLVFDQNLFFENYARAHVKISEMGWEENLMGEFNEEDIVNGGFQEHQGRHWAEKYRVPNADLAETN